MSEKLVADVQLVGAMASLIEAEFGVGVLPSWTISTEVRARRPVPVRLDRSGTVRSRSAAVRKSGRRDRAIKDFIIALSTGVAATGPSPKG